MEISTHTKTYVQTIHHHHRDKTTANQRTSAHSVAQTHLPRTWSVMVKAFLWPSYATGSLAISPPACFSAARRMVRACCGGCDG